jgi:hypothetical protein
MIDENRLTEIRKRLESNAYFINPLSDSNAAKDIEYLLGVVDTLQKKNEVLSQHNLELTQEMENIKSDFGNSR